MLLYKKGYFSPPSCFKCLGNGIKITSKKKALRVYRVLQFMIYQSPVYLFILCITGTCFYMFHQTSELGVVFEMVLSTKIVSIIIIFWGIFLTVENIKQQTMHHSPVSKFWVIKTAIVSVVCVERICHYCNKVGFVELNEEAFRGHEGRGSHYLANSFISFCMFLCSIFVANMFNYKVFVKGYKQG